MHSLPGVGSTERIVCASSGVSCSFLFWLLLLLLFLLLLLCVRSSVPTEHPSSTRLGFLLVRYLHTSSRCLACFHQPSASLLVRLGRHSERPGSPLHLLSVPSAAWFLVLLARPRPVPRTAILSRGVRGVEGGEKRFQRVLSILKPIYYYTLLLSLFLPICRP